MEMNNGKESDSIEKIEKLGNLKVMKFLQREVDIKTFIGTLKW